jgi:guanosine-3',5'-bis(diphosphate) 3'-pyrophosphohydrolase
LVRFAKCCNPLPGDSILGFVTRGRGITVHLNTCSRAIDMDPERRIDVDWDDGASIARPVTVRVTTEDRPGLLAEISQIFTNASVNISEANCKVVGEDRAVNTFEVLIRDKDQLRSVVGKIKGLRGIVSVDRV